MGTMVEGRREVRDKYLDRSVKMWVGQRGRGQCKARQCDCVNRVQQLRMARRWVGRACQKVPGKRNAAGEASAFRVAEGLNIFVGEVIMVHCRDATTT